MNSEENILLTSSNTPYVDEINEEIEVELNLKMNLDDIEANNPDVCVFGSKKHIKYLQNKMQKCQVQKNIEEENIIKKQLEVLTSDDVEVSHSTFQVFENYLK
eukprot:NODE_618_length_5352_cov_0.421854.p6 type:complete len:103 gc:universal NODE_618_length_5352_cov_0.421854:4586-4278(-)